MRVRSGGRGDGPQPEARTKLGASGRPGRRTGGAAAGLLALGTGLAAPLAAPLAGPLPAYLAAAPAAGLVAGVLLASGPALAQGAAAAPAQSFAIAPGPVSTALAEFSAASGINLAYDAAVARGLSSPGVNGRMSAARALDALLFDTGLTYRFTSPSSVTIERRAAAAAPVAPSGGGSLDAELPTITVTGEKLERDLAEVYASVGIVTSQQIFDFVLPDLKASLNQIANTRTFSANQGNSGIVIRGVSSEGLTQPTNSSPVIAVIIDGASQNGEGIRRGSRGTWDVSDVEVFRGPQSTLQGRNAMAGAVIVNTENPTFHWEAAGQGEYAGSDASGEIGSGAFMLSGPLVENQLAFRVAGQISDGNKGILYSDALNAGLDDDEFGQIRGKLLFTPDALPSFRALVTVSRTHDKPGVTAVTGPDFFRRWFGSDVSAVELRETDVTNVVADVSQDLGEGVVLRSVSAFVMTEAQINSPAGSLAFIRADARDGGDFTQDLRLELAEGIRPLSGVIGVNYGRFSADSDSDITLSLPDFGIFDLPYQDLSVSNLNESIAAYADMRYALTDRWSVLFGGRLAYEQVTNTANGRVFNFDTFTYDQILKNAGTDYLVALPKLGLAYKFDDHQRVAFTVSEGFRAGFAAVDFDGQVYDVAPEYLWAYELAYRSRWLDGRLEVNANAFYYDFRDLQIDVDDPNPLSPQTITRNIGKAHAFGGEVEIRTRPVDGLSAFLSLGLLKTEFDQALASTGNYAGNSFPEAPAITLNTGGTYRHPSGFFASADLSYTASFYSVGDIANTPAERVPSYVLVNAALGYEQKNWSVTLYAKNIFDEQYVTGISTSAFGPAEATVGDGRMLGVRAKATF